MVCDIYNIIDSISKIFETCDHPFNEGLEIRATNVIFFLSQEY